MSRTFCWITLVVGCMVFFIGLVRLAELVPWLGLIVTGMVVYVIVATINDMRDLP